MKTIAACATPPGAGALGVLRLSGGCALNIAQTLLRPRGSRALEDRRATVADAVSGGAVIDEVVATYFRGPRSATGEDVVEISCHGSPYIIRRLLQEALNAGARLAEPGEFTQRAFLNGCLDLAQAEAVCELIKARTEQAHRAAIGHLRGGLSRAVDDLRRPILDLLVRIEAGLDHPEEDIPALREVEAAQALRRHAADALNLASSFERGRLAAEGARVCLVGRPNAGKSSLLNALMGRERAIVCPTPGTTRDTLEEAADLDGLPAVLIDTAGLREEARDPAELAGMERARAALESCDVALLVIDGSRPPEPRDRAVFQQIQNSSRRLGRPVISVLNKTDLPLLTGGHQADVRVSALRGEGLGDLLKLIAAKIGPAENQAPPVLVTSLRHYRAISSAAQELLAAAEDAIKHPGCWEELAACRIRASLDHLGSVTGAGAPEEVLREIFSRFCVGK